MSPWILQLQDIMHRANLLLFFFETYMFIIKQSPSHKTKRRNKKQGIHNYTYVTQTNNRRSKHNI